MHVEKARRRPLRLGWRAQAEERLVKVEVSPRQVKSLRLREATGDKED